jgi:hypothetical protein
MSGSGYCCTSPLGQADRAGREGHRIRDAAPDSRQERRMTSALLGHRVREAISSLVGDVGSIYDG